MRISIATKKITIFNHKKLAHVTLQEKMDGIFFFLFLKSKDYNSNLLK